jgi:hypothetical protein
MSTAFTNFLHGLGDSIFGEKGTIMKDFRHADRLYVQNNYARTPKVGFLYFVNFNINQDAISDQIWKKRKHYNDVGLLVKKIDLPKFTVGTETLNQYNRKTVVQTKITYNPVTIDFHDDNSDITNNLWKNYYQYYYFDSIYGSIDAPNKNGEGGKVNSDAFGNTKWSKNNYSYGYDVFPTDPFFTSIDIYVLHKGHGESDFTSIKLINPIVTEWMHDSLNQDENAKIMSNKMTVAYEAVVYGSGKLKKGNPSGWTPVYYDNVPSPIGIGGTGNLFGPGGIIAGAGSIFGSDGSLANASSLLDYVKVGFQTSQLLGNIKTVTSANVANQGYSIAGGVLGGLIGGAASVGSNNNTGQGQNGITIFQNNSVSGTTNGILSNLTGRGK